MELVPYSDGDIDLTVALETDAEVMRELGGPIPRERVLPIHRRRVESVAKGEDWWFKIVPDPESPPAGAIGLWRSTWKGAEIDEVGWMVLPAFQGRGIATGALRLLLDRARRDGRFSRIHAFPGVTNAPSNALCRSFDFTWIEEGEVGFRDRPLRCNHWALDLSVDPGPI